MAPDIPIGNPNSRTRGYTMKMTKRMSRQMASKISFNVSITTFHFGLI
jgi:hypothetical protein